MICQIQNEKDANLLYVTSFSPLLVSPQTSYGLSRKMYYIFIATYYIQLNGNNLLVCFIINLLC